MPNIITKNALNIVGFLWQGANVANLYRAIHRIMQRITR